MLVALVAGCGLTISTDSQALYGKLGGFEWSVDAPWRLEPEILPTNCQSPPCGEPAVRYGAVPLSVVVRDAYQGNLSNTATGHPTEFLSLAVEEMGSGLAAQVFTANAFHEIEWTRGKWSQSTSPGYNGPPHALCRRWSGESCTSFTSLVGTSEWDGTLLYAIRRPATANQDLRLRVSLRYRALVAMAGATVQSVERVVDNTLVVHLGRPLPRFDSRWAYGDLHYHSQGTDNEGESGYSHRTTLQAMSGLGLDFAFATEHASNSGQFDDLTDLVQLTDQILRDMSARRWVFLLNGLNGLNGANLEVTSHRRRRSALSFAAPQIFLGGEVDVIPEVSTFERDAGTVSGPEGSYPWSSACLLLPAEWLLGCESSELSEPARNSPGGPAIPGRWFIKDVQGPGKLRFARQHLLHLASSPTNEQGFVASNTSYWGGATRRLAALLKAEYDEARKGVVFLAHPVDHASGSGMNRLGPDMIPFSTVQLEDAFRTRDVLGLQLWNEDTRLTTTPASWTQPVSSVNAFPGLAFGLYPTWGSVIANPEVLWTLRNGLIQFDRMLHWGLNPAKTAGIGWLAPGAFRKVFLAGGSDAHGDLNYYHKGYLEGLTKLNDTAMGKPRNLVMVGSPQGTRFGDNLVGARALTQQQVVAGLRSGQFIATDGPIVRIAFDANGNGVIDDADVPMGGEGAWSALRPTLPLLVEWQSTAEFGKVTRIDLYVGSFSNALAEGLTWAPQGHGVPSQGEVGSATYTAPNGHQYQSLGDYIQMLGIPQMGPHYVSHNYWRDPTPAGQLRINVPSAEGFSGRRTVVLTPSNFPVGRAKVGRDPCPWDCIGGHSVDGDWVCNEPTCNTPIPRTFESPHRPDSLYIRAVGKTSGQSVPLSGGTTGCVAGAGQCAPRFAFTNPLWARFQPPPENTPTSP